MEIQVQKIHPDAVIPKTMLPGDAGFDLSSVEEVTIPANQRRTLRTGLAMAIPLGNVGLVWDRSGLAHKEGITTFAGVIDATYRGEIMVVMYNSSDKEKTVKKGDRIAQMLIQAIISAEMIEVNKLTSTERGEKGLGSSG